MKKSIASCRSYCHLLRQWTRFSARLDTPAYHSTISSRTTALSQCRSNNPISHRHHIPPGRQVCTAAGPQVCTTAGRQFCTTAEEISEGDEELGEPVPSIPVGREKTNIQAKFRTKHNDPTKHSIEDEGLYYKVPHEDYEKYIQRGQWLGYQKQVKTFQESMIMVRRPALEAFDIIDHANMEYPPLRLFFYGKNGSGKTMSLAHVVHRYAKMGWLTIHVPNMLDLIRFRPTQERQYSLSAYKEGRYDYTDDAMNWLMYFKAQNKHLLENVKTTKECIWSQRETSPEGSELLDIVDFGISRKKYASDCIGVILREIKLKSAEKRFKVLVAVEGVNGFWKNTSIKNEQRKLVSVQEVSTFQHFQKMFQPNWTNGICVGTVCACVDVLDSKNDRDKVPYTPQYLLKKQGFELMDPFIPVFVPEYSTKEAHNCIDYFIERKWIIKPRGLTEEGKKELMMISNKNPYQLMTVSAQW